MSLGKATFDCGGLGHGNESGAMMDRWHGVEKEQSKLAEGL